MSTSSIACCRIPIEIWQTILKEAIYVPVFFEVDPVTSYGRSQVRRFSIEFHYWESERHRNALRRVCSSWNKFLLRFADRYVRYADVEHGWVLPTAIPKAVRFFGAFCACKSCTKGGPNIQHRANETRGLRRRALLKGLVADFKEPWKMKIIHPGLYSDEVSGIISPFDVDSAEALDVNFAAEWFSTYPPYLDGEIFDILHPRICHIRAIHSYRPSPSANLNDMFPMLEGLFSLELGFSSTPPVVLRMSNLTTLQVYSTKLDHFVGWELPSLKHLSVSHASSSAAVDRVEKFLEVHGSNLTTFIQIRTQVYREIENPSLQLPELFWTLCPVLKLLETPWPWPSPLPPQHPLDCVRIPWIPDPPSCESEAIKVFNRIVPIAHAQDAQVKTIILHNAWLPLLFCEPSRYATMVYLRLAGERGFAVIDINGVRFNEYILFLLSAFWRGRSPKARGEGRSSYRPQLGIFFF